MTWRTGHKLGRTLYRDEVCVGMLDTPALAEEVVAALNAHEGGGPSRSLSARVAKLEDMLQRLLESSNPPDKP